MTKKLLAACLLLTVMGRAQTINFPDANFKAKLVAAGTANFIASAGSAVYQPSTNNWVSQSSDVIDTNGDGEIQVSEAQAIKWLNLKQSAITNLSGIEFFTNLESLRVDNNQLTTLNVSQNTALVNLRCETNQLTSLTIAPNATLIDLHCFGNSLTSLNVSQCTALRQLHCNNNNLTSLLVPTGGPLERLNCTGNSLTSLDVSQCASLYYLHCPTNALTTLNVAGCSALTQFDAHLNNLTTLDLSGSPLITWLRVENNNLTSLNISNCTALVHLECETNQLTSLDLTPFPALEWLFCYENNLTSLDVSQCPLLTKLSCYSNDLQVLNLKNGNPQWDSLSFFDNPDMRYICCDEEDLEYVTSGTGSFPNCHVNTYCTFTPGGTFYEVSGSTTFDYNSNGCDSGDFTYANLSYTISDGTHSGTLTANQTGSYYIPVGTGNFTITPTLENPGYFNISPAAITAEFPAQASPQTHNFCVTANGVHPDLEVFIVPVNTARPGFDARYKIIYKNKGNQTAGGTLTFTFDNASMDLVSADPTYSGQSANALTWDFADLQPFELREIALVLNLNGPMETPPVNNDDVLHYTASLSTPATDDTPADNTFTLAQDVLGSLDPNDKTCLEGQSVAPAMVGKYVHYLIRFENVGTFAAENIVVKDMIDTDKFDAASLIPLYASHEFVTRTDGNKVEFLFEGINLPFADAANDGFVVFKIKTRSELVLGDTFSNSANIYFDYNYPILTNNYVTTVQNPLGVQAFGHAADVVVYPNPVKDRLTIENVGQPAKVSVYDMAGRLLMVARGRSIDMSGLRTGNYVVQIQSDHATSTVKIAKQ